MSEARVKISIDDIDFDAHISSIQQRAQQLYGDLITEARSYTTSSKETLRYLEDQIKAVERLGETQRRASESSLKKGYEEGKYTEKQYREGLGRVGEEYKEDQTIASLLKELIETTKDVAKEEIRESRKSVEEQIKESKTVDRIISPEEMGEHGAESILKETIQRDLLGEMGADEHDERTKFQEFIKDGGMANRMIGLGTSKNELYAAAAMVAAIPVVGQGLSMIMSKLLGSAESLETSKEDLHAIMGSGGLDTSSYDKMHRSGYTTADQVQARAAYMRANFRQGYEGEMYAERGLGLDRGELSALATTQRGTGYQAATTANILAGTLTNLTKEEGQTRAYLGEYLSILVDVNREQLSTIGKVDSGINTKVIASLTQLGKEYENPEFLRGVVMSVQQGLRQSQTPQIEAMQYEVLSRVSPGASLWEMRRMMEDPFSAAEGKYLPAMLQSIIDISGSENDAFFNMQSIFGVSGKVAEDLVKMAGDLKTPEQIKAVAGYDLQAEAEEGTGLLKMTTARTDDFFQTTGDKLVQFVEDSVKLFETMGKWLGLGEKGNPMYTIVLDEETNKLNIANEHQLDNVAMVKYVEDMNQFLEQNKDAINTLNRNLQQNQNQVKGG